MRDIVHHWSALPGVGFSVSAGFRSLDEIYESWNRRAGRKRTGLRGMSNLVVVSERTCRSCREMFLPKAGGYNARYCSDRCKRRSQRARLSASDPAYLVAVRKRSYAHTKAKPNRLAKVRQGAKTYRSKVRAWLAAYKKERGCVDCGYSAHAAALQLDHEGEKTVEIADARSSIRRLTAEIEAGRCVVRCANCHSIRTWKSKQAGKGCD